MIREALFSPSPHDELYKPSELIPGDGFCLFRYNHRSNCGSLCCVKMDWF